MKLEDNFYRYVNIHHDGEHGFFAIELLPGCDLYRGHFPGNPVCPGVCSIEIIRQCTRRMTGYPLFIHSIRHCRFRAVMSPADNRELTVEINFTPAGNGGETVARIYDGRQTYVEFKGEMRKEEETISQ